MLKSLPRGVTVSSLIFVVLLSAVTVGVFLGFTGTASANTSVSTCQEISQSGTYELSGDIEANGSVDCFTINASDVVFDGNGHEIFNESDFPSGEGITTTRGISNVTIRNVTVRGMDNNVELAGVTGARVEDITTVEAEDDGIQIDHSENLTITRVNASSNHVYGISAIDSSNLTVEETNVTGSWQSNIRFDAMSDSLVTTTNSSVAGVGGSGVYLNHSVGITVRDSTLVGNDENGVFFEATNYSTVDNVTARYNGIHEIYIYSSSIRNTISNNTLRDSDAYEGIDLADAPHNVVRNNTLNGTGIEVRAYSDETYNVTVANNTVHGAGNGILVNGNQRARYDEEPASVYDIYLRNNTITQGGVEEIGVWLLAASNVTMRDNTISGYEHNFIVEEYYVEDAGYSIRQFYHDIDTSNTVDGDPIYYLLNESDRTIGPADDPGFVGVYGGSNITVRDVHFHNSSPGVLLAGTQNATIHNVTAEDVEFGVKTASTEDTTIENSTFRNLNENEWAVWLANSSNNDIRANEFVQNEVGNNGIKAWNDSDGNVVENNTISYGGELFGNENGIFVGSGSDDNRIASNVLNATSIDIGGGYPDADGNDVVDNVVWNVLEDPGIDAGSRANWTSILGNRVVNATADDFSGTAIRTGTNATVRNNTVLESDGNGILSMTNSTVADNLVRNVEQTGIEVPNDRSTISNNTIETAEYGVFIEGENNTITENTIRNTTRDGTSYGIYEREYAKGTVIRNNTINGTVTGIHLGGEGKYGNVSKNTILDSRVGIKIRNDEAGNHTIEDTTVEDNTEWIYRDETRYGGEASDTWTQVRNLSTTNLSLSFTHKAIAFGETIQPACDPTSEANLGVFLNVTNTSASGWWDVTLDYTDVTLGGADESSLTLYRYDGSSWSAVSATQDEAANTLSANVSTFGVYGLFANGTATCANGLLALSETTTLPSDQVSAGIDDDLRVESSLAANASATLLNNTVEEFSIELNVTGGPQNVTFWLNATTLEASLGNLSNVNLTVDGVKQPYYVETFEGDPWVGFEIDHFSNRTVAFMNASAAVEKTTLESFEATVSEENVTTELNTTGTLSALTVDITNSSGTVRSLSLSDFTESEIGSTGNYTYLNTIELAPSTYNVTLASATDQDGNEIGSGQTSEVTIAPPPSVTLSNVTAIDATDGDGNVTTGDTVEVRADAGGTVNSVTANASDFGGSSFLSLTDGDGDGTYNETFTVDASSGAGDGDHDIDVTASNAENSSAATTNSLTLDASAPTFYFNSVTDLNNSDGEVGDGDRVRINTTAYDLETGINYVAVVASDFGAGTVFLSDSDGDSYYNGTFTVNESKASADGDYQLSGTAYNNVDLSTSNKSTTLTLNTSLGTSDSTEPVLRNATMIDFGNPADYVVNDGELIRIAVNVSDTGGSRIASVTADASGFGAGRVSLSDNDSDGRYDVTFAVNASAAPGDASILPQITATDGASNSNSTTPTYPVTLDTTPPTADVVANRTTIDPGEAIAFNASGSSDPSPGRLSKHSWDFQSDGVTDTFGFFTDPTVTHTFTSAGIYTVLLNVTDDADNYDTATVMVTVNDSTAPSITSASITDFPDDDSIVADGDKVRAAAAVSDDGTGVSSVTINLSDLGAFGPVSLTDDDDDGIYDKNFTVDGGNAGSDGTFDFTVTAQDTAGNVRTATTNSLTLDTIGPLTSDVFAYNLDGLTTDVRNGHQVRVTANVSDETTGVASVVANASLLGAGSAVPMGDADGDGQYMANVTVDSSTSSIAASGTKVTITVLATDEAGNEGFEEDSNDLTLNYSTADTTPPEPTSGNLSVTTASLNPTVVSPGDAVNVTATVENTGSVNETGNVSLIVNDTIVENRTVTVPANSNVTEHFDHTFPSAGTFEVVVNDVSAGNVTVEDVTTVDDGQPGFGVGLAVLVVLLVALILRRPE